jgi:hypothetical protein
MIQLTKMTKEQKIALFEKWAIKHYDNGADTIIECWEEEDFNALLQTHNNSVMASLRLLSRLASVYRERQADAAYHQSQAF